MVAQHTIRQHETIEFTEGDVCPNHGNAHKKTYTFGSSMSGETDVCVFRGCRCAVAICHDPVGTYQASAHYHGSYESAAGQGRLYAMLCAAKYR